MAIQTVSLSIPEICTIEGAAAPAVSEYTDPKTGQTHLVIEFTHETPDAAVKHAKAVVRELVNFRQDKNVQGTRTNSKIMFVFGVEGAEIPATWKGRSAHAIAGAKPEILTEIQAALKGYGIKALYFNSSVNEGLTVDSVPVGLQFEVKDGECVAKLLMSKKGEWTEHPIADTDQAVELVQRLQSLLKDL